MAAFGTSSHARLITCNAVLQTLMGRVVVRRDCSCVCGHRNEADQSAAFNAVPQKSKVQWPHSKHNSLPSMAVDVVPWPEKWSSEEAFLELHRIITEEWAYMQAAGEDGGFKLRWGGDWDGDGDRTDQTFNDFPHWELV